MSRKKSDYGPSRRRFLGFGLSAIVLGRTLKAADEPGAECPATGEDIEGPFWQKDAPFKNRLRLEKHAAGEPLRVSGKVTGFPGCAPLKDAVLDVWQADHAGNYDNEKGESAKFELRGRLKTDDKGNYEFETIVPGAYSIGLGRSRPKHIHYKISCPGYKELTTQLYFTGDPFLAKDPWASKSRTVDLVKHADAEEMKKLGVSKPFYTAVFNIVLKKA